MDIAKGNDAAATKPVLYSYWQSSCAWRVRFALNLKEVPYEYRAVDLFKGEQFTPAFQRLNPLGYIPVLVDGDVVVSDSYAILMVSSVVSSSIQPLHRVPVLELIEEKVGSEERLSWAQYHMEKGFSALEKLLKNCAGRYATGETLCMADVFLAPQIAVATPRFKVDMSKFPTLARIYESYKT